VSGRRWWIPAYQGLSEFPPFLFFMTWVQFRVFRNSYSPLTYSFKSFWSRMRFVVEVITNGGGLLDFLGASSSSSLQVQVSSSERCKEVVS
jgi:hypothetical protein